VFGDVLIELLANEAAEVEEDVWEREREALSGCLAQMAAHHRELVLAPYAGEGRVTRLAGETGRSINSLYKLLGRLREKLAQCVQNKISNPILP
jgi:RNA polymerase sigma-70 factor (ECF subfamily)